MSTTTRPAIILLHGAVLNHRMWDPVVTELGPEYQIHRPDLPGHGIRSGEPFRLARAVALVGDLVRSLGSTPVVLSGDSLGSYVSIATIATLGTQLRGAFLAGSTARFQGLGLLPYLFDIGLTRLVPPAKLLPALENRIRRDYPAGAGIVEGGLRPAAFGEAVWELRSFDARAALARATIPVGLVNGGRDWRHRVAEGGTVVGGRPAVVQRIAEVGHGVSLSRPTIFAGMLRQFVAGITP